MEGLNSHEPQVKSIMQPSSQTDTNYLEDYFKRFNVNNDGKISLDEINQELSKNKSFFDTNKEKIQLLFNKYDKDFDGKIIYEEFRHFYGELNDNYNEKLIQTQVELTRYNLLQL